MTPNRSDALDLPGLAEDIAADRRTLANVIDQIASTEPDDAARRRAVSELQALVLAKTAARRQKRAIGESPAGMAAAPVESEGPLEGTGSKRQFRSLWSWRVGLPLVVAAAATVTLVVVVVALVAGAIAPA